MAWRQSLTVTLCLVAGASLLPWPSGSTRRIVSAERRPDRFACRYRAQRRGARPASRGFPLRGDRRHQVLLGQPRRSGVQFQQASSAILHVAPESAAPHAMSTAPAIRILHPRNVRATRQLRHHRPPVQSQGAQSRSRSARIPSLRGARFLAPYGNDGRSASLREFVRNVVVNEFAGPEPSPAVLDALVAYIEDIDFLPNPRLAVGGHLTTRASEAARRGELLFMRPFPHDPHCSCAGCHIPTGAFVDHRQHSVGSGGLFEDFRPF